MVQVSYPGVYVREVPSGSRTITGVSTSVALFVGMSRRGRLDVPVRVTSFADFERRFSGDPTLGELAHQVRQFFTNGGQQAHVVRVARAGTTQAAELALHNDSGAEAVLRLAARDVGTDGNTLRARVDYATAQPDASFNLRIYREAVNAAGSIEVVADERFDNLVMNPDHPRFVETVLNQQSSLAVAEVPAAVRANSGIDPSAQRIAGYSLSGLIFDGAASGADIRDALNAVVAPSAPGETPRNLLQLRVDDGPPVTVTLPAAPALNSGPIGPWTTAINTALAPHGTSVVAELVTSAGAGRLLRIRSAADGGSVVVSPAPGADASASLQLGVEQGGVEVGGFARQRPAPNGLFAQPGDPSALFPALLAFAAAPQPNLTTLTLTDASGGAHSGVALPVVFPPSATVMMLGDAYTPPSAAIAGSLINVRENLRIIGNTLAAAARAWTASVQGHRLVLLPTFGGTDADPSASLTSGAAFDLGAANQLFDTDANGSAYRLGNGALGATYFSDGVGGQNGDRPAVADYERAFAAVRREVDLFNLLVLPRALDQSDAERAAIWGVASGFCREQRAFLLVDPPRDWRSANDVDAGITALRIGVTTDHAAVYWPRLVVPQNGANAVIDPAGTIAGLMARIDANRGVWKAPAGVEADLRTVRGVEHAMADVDNGVLNQAAVNAIRAQPTGILAWGARTMAGFDNSGNDDYRYVSIRRLALLIEESLSRGLQFAVFEPNDEPLWAQIRLAAGGFMNNLFRQGAFAGQKSTDAYFVKCDAETTTQNDINLGIVNVVVGFAPLKPAEFVVVTIQQTAGQVQV